LSTDSAIIKAMAWDVARPVIRAVWWHL